MNVEHVVNQALSIAERFDLEVVPGDDLRSRERAEANLSRWLEVVADRDQLRFANLALLPVSSDEPVLRLGNIMLSKTEGGPRWVMDLPTVAQALTLATDSASESDVIKLDKPMAFESILIRLVAAALKDIKASAARNRLCVTEAAFTSMGRQFLTRLSRLAGPALLNAFVAYRIGKSPFGSQWISARRECSHDYDEFVEVLQGCKMQEFLDDNPVLWRLLATAYRSLVDSLCELLQRLNFDKEIILSRFFGLHAPCDLTLSDIDLALSDPHDGWRVTAIIVLGGMHRVVYKPRSGSMSVAWGRLLDWLQFHQAPYELRAPRIVDRGKYHWAECISSEPESVSSPDVYYRRCGALLCLLHAFRVTDMHHENILCTAGGPVVIDHETIMHPDLSFRMQDRDRTQDRGGSVDWITNSVLATGVLPDWGGVPGGHVAPIGALNSASSIRFDTPTFEAVNSDAVTLSIREVIHTQVSPFPAQFRPDTAMVVRGFREMYHYILASRELLLTDDGPLSYFNGCECRVVLLPTQTYWIALDRSLHASNMGDGARWSLYFDSVLKTTAGLPHFGLLRAAQVAVRKALENLDIPRFWALSNERSIKACGVDLPDALPTTPIALVRERICSMSFHDLAVQTEIIEEAFAIDLPEGAVTSFQISQESPALTSTKGAAAPIGPDVPDRLLSGAIEIADIARKGILKWEREMSWLSVSRVGVGIGMGHTYRLDECGWDLYAGRSGVALFFAAIGKFAALDEYTGLSSEIMRPWLDHGLPTGLQDSLLRPGSLGIAGIASAVFSLGRLWSMTGDERYYFAAQQLHRVIRQGATRLCGAADVVDGLAGLLHSLISFYGLSHDDCVIDLATRCGDALLHQSRRQDCGGIAWPSQAGVSLLGISHGAAGIASSLARLAQLTGREKYLDCCTQALDFEDHHYMKCGRHWPDLRRSTASPVEVRGPSNISWCHGAAGGLIARSIMQPLLPADSSIANRERERISAAASLINDASASTKDYLCCGESGRIEALLVAAESLALPALEAAGMSAGVEMLNRFTETGSYRLPGKHAHFNVGFFTGLSGIGYTYLRLRFPRDIPSVISFE